MSESACPDCASSYGGVCIPCEKDAEIEQLRAEVERLKARLMEELGITEEDIAKTMLQPPGSS